MAASEKGTKGSAGRWDLLRHAVNCAEAEDEVAAIDTDDFAVKEIFRDDVERDAIVWVVEDRDENEFVGDVKVCVACGKALAVEIDRRRHREFLDAKLPAGLILALFENGEIFLEMSVVGVVFVFFHDSQHCSFVDEAREIVNVAVCVVSGYSVFQPNRVRNAE